MKIIMIQQRNEQILKKTERENYMAMKTIFNLTTDHKHLRKLDSAHLHQPLIKEQIKRTSIRKLIQRRRRSVVQDLGLPAARHPIKPHRGTANDLHTRKKTDTELTNQHQNPSD